MCIRDRDYKETFGENKKNNPYYEADNTMAPVLAGDPIRKVPFAKERKRKRNQSSSSEKEQVPNGTLPNSNRHTETSVNTPNGRVPNGHIQTSVNLPNVNGHVHVSSKQLTETDHAKED